MFLKVRCRQHKNHVRKWLIWVQIFLQILFPLLPTFSISAQQSIDSAHQTAPQLDDLRQVATSLATNDLDQSINQAKGMAVSAATSSASSSVQSWLSQFGTAEVQLNVDQEGHWDQSSMDLLVPLYDDKKSVLFSQLGMRAPNDRLTTNLGMGVRTYYLKGWMIGSNVFFDNDVKGKNRRVGMGLEAWTDYLKLSANSYLGTSEWHSSRDFDDYDEKPADGFDIRAEGWLPAAPAFGAKIMYEKYYGEKVALFDTDHLQNNPSAVTVGISYTPIPLITLATNYRRGQDDMNDTQLQVGVKYDFSHDWRYQLSADNVALARTLAGSRYDLVERNNQIILQYKKKADHGVSVLELRSLTDDSPADGLTQNTLLVRALDSDKNPVVGATIVWSSTGNALRDKTASTTDINGTAILNMSDTEEEVVNVTATSGNVSQSIPTHFHAVTASNIVLTINKNDSVADGVATDDATVRVSDINDRPIKDAKLSWSIAAPASISHSETVSDLQGLAHIKVNSLKAGEMALTVRTGDLKDQKTVQFTANEQQAKIVSFDMVTDKSLANGIASDTALVTVRDPAGNPIQNESVKVAADKATVVIIPATNARGASAMQTDPQGQLRIAFTDTVAESATITASLNNGSSRQTQALFVADSATQQLENLQLTQDKSPADGHSQNQAVVYVRDKNHNPLSGVRVNWNADRTSVKFASSSPTDADGKTTVLFTDTVAEVATIKASLVNGNSLRVESHFVGDTTTAGLHELRVTKDGAPADGVKTNTAQVYVLDGQGNPLANQLVTWSSDPADTVFVPQTTSSTDSSGKAQIGYTSTVAQTIQLTAAITNGQKATVPSLFNADSGSMQITSYVVSSGAVADGVDTNTAKVVVKDAQGNPVKNEKVNWDASGAAEVSVPVSTTDEQGVAAITLTDIKSERVAVHVQLTNGASESKDSLFIADRDTARISTLTTTTGAIADGVKTNSATVSVVDAQGNAMPLAEVTWKVMTGRAVVSQTKTTTQANGQSSITLTDLHAETVTLTATIKNGDVKDATSEFVADSDNPVISSLVVTHNGSPADGKTTNTAEIVVMDAHQNLLKDSPVNWTFNSATVHSPASAVTDSQGKAVVNFTDTIEQSVDLTATLKNGAHKTVSSEFVADVASAVIALDVATDSQLADGQTSDVIHAQVTDALGHALGNQTILWSITNSTAANIDPTSQTDSSGLATAHVTDTLGENVNIVATLSSHPSSTANVTARFVSHSVSSLTVIGATKLPADGQSQITLAAVVTDEKGSVVKNSPVSFSSSGNGKLSATTVNTDTSGQAVVRVSDATPESITLTAKSADYSLDNGKTQTVEFTSDQITGISVEGYNFAPDAGFPQTGFISAKFAVIVGGDATKNSDYTWTSNQSWIYIDTPGVIRMAIKPTTAQKNVVITATPKSGQGAPLVYTFALKHWITNLGRSGSPTKTDKDCSDNSMTTPSYTALSNAAPGSTGSRSVGNLWGEWGDLSHYDWSTSSTAESVWASETGKNGSRIYVHWRDGYVNENVPSVDMNEICLSF